ncbi:tyrosine-type recombinase/integrase, partial [Flammeovirga pacifica]|uniref:tyrosine-type recombinase/integrase n=1 Tax=Flammeovirga pacifica TaxID=915059 RepID=UPI001A8DD7F2
MNRQLKLIAQYSNINKNITVHSARKTFATSMINMNVSKESLQVMLGHKSSRTTEMYYKIHDHKVINEVLNIY